MMVQNLISLCVNPKQVRRHLRSLHDALAAVDAAEKRLNDARVEHDAAIAKDRAELAAERHTLLLRRQRVEQSETELEQKRETIRKLESSWNNLALPGEPAPLYGSITRSRPYSGLAVAKHYAEHGVLPDHPDAPLPTEDSEAQAEPSPVAADRHGQKFPPGVTLTHTPEAPVRVRPGRRAVPSEKPAA